MNRNTEILTFAQRLADAAGAAIRPYFGAHGDVENKEDDSPVTIADRAAEAAMRKLIEQHYPDHAIYGEEFGQQLAAIAETKSAGSGERSASEPLAAEGQRSEGNKEFPSIKNYTWVLDPIDGTRAFIAGGNAWGTLIALCENGVPILGILDQPITGERWVGMRGEATLYIPSPAGGGLGWGHSEQQTNHAPLPTSPRRGEEIKTRACATLAHAEISTTSARYFTPPQAAAFVKLAEQCGEVIENGDCYAYGLLACGLRDIVVDAGLKPYDILALVPIINGAGGKITGWDGGAITLNHADTAIASGSPALHGLVQAIINGH